MVPIAGNPLIAPAVARAYAEVQIEGIRETASSWRIPVPATAPRGFRLLMDAGPHAPLSVRISREIQRSNPRLAPIDALLLSARVVDAARANGLPPAFLAATLLQESGFAPDAMSPAGAVGIAQFMVSTALAHGVADPWNPDEAIVGAAALLAGYVQAYRGRAEDPFDLAMAAYNAGPGAVTRYGGIPPYPETVEYIDDIKDRWSRIVGR